MSDLQKIVDARNAKLAKARAPKRVKRSPQERRATDAQLNAALGIAPMYVQQAIDQARTRAACLAGRKGS